MDTVETVPSSETSPSASPKPKRPRKKKAPAKPPRVKPSVQAEPECRGRLGSDLRKRRVDWLYAPWFPKGMLSMVVGLPGVGKSTFAAWLISQAESACILPGYEEEVEISVLGRMEANGVKLRCVRFLDDRNYTLPRDKQKIASIMTGWEAELLVVDPVDSYMDDDLSENNGKDVRGFLEAFAWIARETCSAVVAIRHPGKDRSNLFPGSRQWRAVPRSLVHLVSDGGTPERLMVRHFRDPLSQGTRPREYLLTGKPGEPKIFSLKGEMDVSLNELAGVASDPGDRQKVLEAANLIRHMFTQEDKPAVQDLVAQCRLLGIGEHARDHAKRLLGIKPRPLEAGGKWVMIRTSTDWPPWMETGDKMP